ncbi:MAG TPA: biotin--[acetyl-CoA-carboxylase] ligase [Sulfurovum sp.]|nr:biotin--[acetyl-CoA-carboxylase] ligase [Sulfurovum sp.]
MEIKLFETLPSTQKYLIEQLQKNTLEAPIGILALQQDAGVGSRDNEWSGGRGNFFTSIAVKLQDLPKDLSLASASIYFSYIMKQTLVNLGENVWLKWPNDLYMKNEKIGGIITQKVKDTLVCGIGINLKKSQNGYSALQSDISSQFLLDKYLLKLEKFPNWKEIFSEYEIEFEQSREFSVHIENYKKSLVDACLQDDGSLIIEGVRVFSLR